MGNFCNRCDKECCSEEDGYEQHPKKIIVVPEHFYYDAQHRQLVGVPKYSVQIEHDENGLDVSSKCEDLFSDCGKTNKA